jgi:LysR family glycine cleavage system transcriptional activator
MLGWVTLASHALAAGQLVAPFPERARTGLGYYIVTTRGRREPRIDDFKAWLKSEIAQTIRSFPVSARNPFPG